MEENNQVRIVKRKRSSAEKFVRFTATRDAIVTYLLDKFEGMDYLMSKRMANRYMGDISSNARKDLAIYRRSRANNEKK